MGAGSSKKTRKSKHRTGKKKEQQLRTSDTTHPVTVSDTQTPGLAETTSPQDIEILQHLALEYPDTGLIIVQDGENSTVRCTFYEIQQLVVDRSLMQKVEELAERMGPQPYGHREVVAGVLLRWGIPSVSKSSIFGGEPRDKRDKKVDTLANAPGNNQPVRALYPQLPPPVEPRV